MSFIHWCCEKGAKSHVAKEISARGRRRSRDEKGNKGVGDFRFINILQLFSIYFFFSISLLYLFFNTFFLPTPTTHDPAPRPTTSTHYPRPSTFSYTQFKLSLQKSCIEQPQPHLRLLHGRSIFLLKLFFIVILTGHYGGWFKGSDKLPHTWSGGYSGIKH